MQLTVGTKSWPMREPFEIARGVQTEVETVVVTLDDGAGAMGRGEACGVPYAGETAASMRAQVEGARDALQSGLSRRSLVDLLPAGGARCAVDAALWDLDAKRLGLSVFAMAGVADPAPVVTAFTIGIRGVDGYETAAHARREHRLLKIKVGADDPIAAVAAARRGAPDAAFIVDPNQSWSLEALQHYAPMLEALGVVLLEQPVRVGDEEGLDGYRCPVSLCADELVSGIADLARAKGRFDVVNIKLDKTGGLTAALDLADAARAMGFELMVGCMAGSSLCMAPAMVLAQQCRFVDLDGPLLQSEDWPGGLSYQDGVIQLPRPDFWG